MKYLTLQGIQSSPASFRALGWKISTTFFSGFYGTKFQNRCFSFQDEYWLYAEKKEVRGSKEQIPIVYFSHYKNFAKF